MSSGSLAGMRISELREYSQRDTSSVPQAREVASDYVPNAAATQALTRRSYGGLAFTESTPRRAPERVRLGELVQVVTTG